MEEEKPFLEFPLTFSSAGKLLRSSTWSSVNFRVASNGKPSADMGFLEAQHSPSSKILLHFPSIVVDLQS